MSTIAPPRCKVCGKPYEAASRAALAVFGHPACVFRKHPLTASGMSADLDARALAVWSLRLQVAARDRASR